jgi:hypothetical protein
LVPAFHPPATLVDECWTITCSMRERVDRLADALGRLIPVRTSALGRSS